MAALDAASTGLEVIGLIYAASLEDVFFYGIEAEKSELVIRSVLVGNKGHGAEKGSAKEGFKGVATEANGLSRVRFLGVTVCLTDWKLCGEDGARQAVPIEICDRKISRVC